MAEAKQEMLSGGKQMMMIRDRTIAIKKNDHACSNTNLLATKCLLTEVNLLAKSFGKLFLHLLSGKDDERKRVQVSCSGISLPRLHRTGRAFCALSILNHLHSDYSQASCRRENFQPGWKISGAFFLECSRMQVRIFSFIYQAVI